MSHKPKNQRDIRSSNRHHTNVVKMNKQVQEQHFQKEQSPITDLSEEDIDEGKVITGKSEEQIQEDLLNDNIKIETIIHEDVVINTAYDRGGNCMQIDLIPIASIKRFAYNVVQNILSCVLDEASMQIQTVPVPIVNQTSGKPTGAFKDQVRGHGQNLKMEIDDPKAIALILKKRLNIDSDDELEKVFIGFSENKKAVEKINKIVEDQKLKEQQTSPILSETGEQIIKE